MVKNINDYMREIDRIQAKNSIDFLNQTASKTNINQIKEAISRLLENQIQSLMMVESNEDYILKQIISPIAPEKKSGPARTVIVLFGLIFSVIQLFILIVLYFVSPKFNWWQFDFDKIFNEPIYFSYLIKYPFVNLIGVLSILIGWSIFKKARSDKKSFLRILIFYFIGFVLILLSNLNRF